MRMGELSDLVSPILVKELRQGRRSRGLVLLAVLTFLAAGLIAFVFVTGGDDTNTLFVGLYSCLSLVGFLIFPLMAHRSLVREQEAGSWDILQLTGLGPRRIIAGKLMSSVAEMAILSLAVAPFLLVCHFHEDKDLATIALACTAGAVVTGGLTVLALFAATLPSTRSQRNVVQVVLMLGLVLGMSGSIAMANDVGRRGVELGPMLASFGGIFVVSYVLFEAAAARLSLVTEDYAWRPRLALLILLIGVSAIGVVRHAEREGIVWNFIAIVIVACGALGMATEADRAGPPRRRGWSLSLFAPGALSGFRMAVVLLGLVTALWIACLGSAYVPLLIAAPCYLTLYLSTALWIGRVVGRRGPLATPDGTRVTFMVLLAIGTFVPWMIAKATLDASPLHALRMSGSEPFLLGYISPAYGLVRFSSDEGATASYGHWVVLALAVIAAVATDRMLARRARKQA